MQYLDDECPHWPPEGDFSHLANAKVALQNETMKQWGPRKVASLGDEEKRAALDPENYWISLNRLSFKHKILTPCIAITTRCQQMGAEFSGENELKILISNGLTARIFSKLTVTAQRILAVASVYTHTQKIYGTAIEHSLYFGNVDLDEDDQWRAEEDPAERPSDNPRPPSREERLLFIEENMPPNQVRLLKDAFARLYFNTGVATEEEA